MIEDPTFWDDEGDSPLLSRGFTTYPRDKLNEVVKRVRSWVDLLDHDRQIDVDESQADHCTEERWIRIFKRDSERTFVPKDDPEVQVRTQKRWNTQIQNLKLVHSEVQDYHQGLGYLVAFLQLFLNTEEVARICFALHRSKRHSAGYFQAEPAGFGRDAVVFERILELRMPALLKQFKGSGVLAHGYAVKWFIGLGVHVLAFEDLLDYWEAYFQYGFEFLYAWGEAFMKEFQGELEASKDTSSMMGVLRMEDPKGQWLFPEKVQGARKRLGRVSAAALDIVASQGQGSVESLEKLRQEEEFNVGEKIRKAKEYHENQKLIDGDDGVDADFSDED